MSLHHTSDAPSRPKRFTEGKLNNDLILKELGLVPGQTAVDIGCGTGYMARLFAQEVGLEGMVYALDVNPQYITELQAECDEPNLRPMVSDVAGGCVLPDDTADLVYLSTVLHAQRRDTLPVIAKELQRVLRPGGTLAVVEIAKHDTPFGPPVSQRFSPEELQQALLLSPVKTVDVAEHFYLQLFRNS
ncbi:methyltransferase domain-containing protein [Pseudodesulfovibrio sp. zrk46]|uniref:class I SAM-dependent methyltransferase n=1 Tax=Pseudodesulfovibrio sp. zrk46 TaxID=2725288 RepID=UPI001448DFFD|nr:methyltransferase domain-containing protein [Pseudodesulfovibrio sp. zrk46]QJB55140.1 methyltransferase domain-containing protein [Pseudodesulfovibrio sp. zrk46]